MKKLFLFLIFSPIFLYAASLTFVSDTISTSAPGKFAEHTIGFRPYSTVPPGGKIILTPAAGVFSIPATFDYQSVDMAIATSSGGVFVDRDLAASADAIHDGVAVVSGASGSITITLNSTVGIPAGESVQVKLGTNASFGVLGIDNIKNPIVTGSQKITVETQNASGARIDLGAAMVAIVQEVTVGPINTTDLIPPTISGGLPTGLLPGGTANVELTVTTSESAVCRFATTTGVTFNSMTNVFTTTKNGNTVHGGALVTGLVNGQTYNYYVKCRDIQLNVSPGDYIITFTIGVPPGTPGSSTGGGTAPGNVPPYSGPPIVGNGLPAGGGDYLKTASVSFSGLGYPNAKITILKDGKEEKTLAALPDGTFSTDISGLERGTYSFDALATDPTGKKSAPYASTISIISDTGNTITNMLIAPTLSLTSASTSPGDPITVFGYGARDSLIDVYLGRQGRSVDLALAHATTTTAANGSWQATLPTKGLAVATYEVRARTVQGSGSKSDLSISAYVGVGQDVSLDFASRSDLNGDKKVNIIDFSILLTFWGTDDARADLNADGKVGIADFSILLFNWTG